MIKNFKTNIILLAFAMNCALCASAQETKKPSPLWFEAGLTYSNTHLTVPNHFADNASVACGVNRTISEHASWGILLWAGYQAGNTPAHNNLGGTYQCGTLALIPNLTFNYPITQRIFWTPRAYLSLGVSHWESLIYSTNGGIDAPSITSLNAELGVQPCSFDVRLNSRCAFNFSLNLLNLRISPELIQVPLGEVSASNTISTDNTLLTVGFRWRLSK